MTFTSLEFAALLAIVLGIRLTLGRTKQEDGYIWALTIASLIFYAWYIPWHVTLLLLIAILNFGAALGISMQKVGSPARKALMIGAVGTNLLLLGFFKYGNFILSSAYDLAGIPAGTPGGRLLNVALPIGISFYTFHAISYTVDVYRGRTRVLTDIRSFLLYLCFFPQLVAGPITRAREFLYQIPRKRRLSRRVVSEGLYLMIRGFFMKMVVADNISPVVDKYWPVAGGPDGGAYISLSVIVLFSMQIFADFSGYTDIARGVAYLLGYRLPLNFNCPYISASFSEFWRRWHISLSSWLRDYLYVPLGGNRISRVRTYVNLLIVMVLGGLWHGAAFTFLLWGAIHGAALAVERLLGWQRLARWWQRLLWAVAVQVVVLIAWTYFRATSVAEANTILANVITLSHGGPIEMSLRPAFLYAVPVLTMHLRGFLRERRLLAAPGLIETGLWAAVMAYAAMTLYGRTPGPFIYFQF
jgi:D-alanyl-lipoteichoic acid acyltransferase DltB (MBOAT superfamily)